MKNTVKTYLKHLRKDRARHRRLAAVLVCLSVVVAGGTTWALHMNGESQTGETYCGYAEEHQHDESCIGEKVLICGYNTEGTTEEDATTAETETQSVHTHSDACYETQSVLICTEDEHTHSAEDGCYDEDGNLTCQLLEHTHSVEAGCYTEESVLVCGKEEGSPEVSDGDATEASTEPATEPEIETASETTHVHTEECYEITYICGKEEHQHKLSCYSNPEADLETADDWEKTVSNVELTGDFATDLVAIAKTQLGYAESTDNYQVVLDDEGNETTETKGYTRYGAWYGDAYGDWCAMFVSFCLNYADITNEMVPYAASCPEWVESLSQLGFYEPVLVEALDEDGNTITVRSDYTPEQGDLVFFDWDSNGAANHVGIVEELETKEVSNSDGTVSYEYIVHTIEGNSSSKVAQREYDLYDEEILGYGSIYSAYLSAVDDGLMENVRHLTAETEDGVTFSAIGEIPENAVLEVSPLTEEQNAYLQENGLTGIFYDIKILVDGEKYQPTSPIQISISGLGYDASTVLEGYHLTVDAENLTSSEDVEFLSVDVQNTGNRIAFEADSFSIYGVGELTVETYIDVDTDTVVKQLTNIDVTALDGKTVAIVSSDGTYAMSKSYYNTTNSRNLTAVSGWGTGYVIWTFEAVDASAGTYKIKNGNDYLYFNSLGFLKFGSSFSGTNYANTFTVTNGDGNTINLYASLTNNSGTSYSGYIATASDSNGTYFGRVENSTSAITLYESVPVAEVEGVSPASTIINLFDYRVNLNSNDDWDENTAGGTTGINYGHYLQFTESSDATIGTANKWTGANGGVLQGIVSNSLTDGYPTLSGDATVVGGNTESLDYLFNSDTSDYKKAYTDVQNLLQIDSEGYYYYDSNENFAEFDDVTNRFTLYNTWAVTWQPDGGSANNGQFFPFDSLSEVEQTTSANNGTLNHFFGMTITTRFINRYEGYTNSNRDTATTFHFSGDDDVWIFIDGVLVADLGGIHDAASVDIDFVKGSVTISKVYNSSGGETNQTTYFSSIFSGSSGLVQNTDSDGETYTTFANNSTHTLQFYYLERGGNASNLELKYNLTEIPATSIFKVDQYGDYVADATFALYPAYVNGEVSDGDSWYYATSANASLGAVSASDLNLGDFTYNPDNWSITYGDITIPALYYGKTDSNGSMTFMNTDQMPMSLSEIQEKLGNYFILREVQVPDGYRTVSDEAFLYIANNTTILCSDPYATGVWVSPNAQITATNKLYVASTSNSLAENLTSNSAVSVDNDGNYIINYYDAQNEPNGTLFAVVLKRNSIASDASSYNDLNIPDWYPLYGNDEKGYTVSESNDLQASIDAAKAQAEISSNVFTTSASGMQLTYTDLPGDPTRYYSYMLANNMPVTSSDPQYLVAYYWTTGTLAEAETTNTVRVSSHATTTAGTDSGFDVQWGATIEVPNVINALYFQKADSDGDLVDDAQFALYEAATDSNNKGYYKGTDSSGNPVYIRLDEENGTAKDGAATVYTELGAASGTTGTYTMTVGTTMESGYYTNEGAGTITVTVDGTNYTISPAKNADNTDLVGYTHTDCDYVYEPGTGHFHLIPYGTYFLKEVASPAGYSMNYANVPVEVTEQAVYANAGDTTNGVRVGNGAGYLVKTMDVFASLGNIDETLSWIYTHLKLKADSGDFLKDVDAAFSELGGYSATDSQFNGYGIPNTDGKETNYIPASALADTKDMAFSSDSVNKAMTQYLQYEGDLTDGEDKEKIFDYALYGRDETNAADSYRLWTEAGWSDLAIYQDYDYGSAQTTTATDGTANPSTAYTDLRESAGYGEISYLFSSSTFVQIEDAVDVDLTVTKVTTDFEDEDGNTATVYLDDAVFYVYRYVDSNGNIVEAEDATTTADDGTVSVKEGYTKQYYKYTAATETTEWVGNENQATRLTTTTTFTSGSTEYTVETVVYEIYNATEGSYTYSKVYTLYSDKEKTTKVGDYRFGGFNEDGTATLIPVTVNSDHTTTDVENGTSLTGTLARSYFKIYNLQEGTYYLHEETPPSYTNSTGGTTTFNPIDDITIVLRSGEYWYYESSSTGNIVIVSDKDILTSKEVDGVKTPITFTYRTAEGKEYTATVGDKVNTSDGSVAYGFTFTNDDGNTFEKTLYLNDESGFTLEVDGDAATRVFKVDSTGTTAPYYDTAADGAYQGGFRVLNSTQTSEETLTLVKLNETAIDYATSDTSGYQDDGTFAVTGENGTLSTHNILTGAQFYLYYTTESETSGSQPDTYYYYIDEDEQTGAKSVRWSTNLEDANKIEVDNDGSLTFTSLNAGRTYYLVECQAPDGYNLLTEELVVSWDDDGKLVVKGATSGDTYHLETVTKTTGEGDDTVTTSTTYLVVYNGSSYALPHTGGAGTYMFTLGGIAILAVVTLVYGCGLRRRRERRAE